VKVAVRAFTNSTNDAFTRLVRLLQLASPALPIVAYSCLQGLEWAVEVGTIRDEVGAQQWLGDLLEWNLGRFEAPLVGGHADRLAGRGYRSIAFARCGIHCQPRGGRTACRKGANGLLTVALAERPARLSRSAAQIFARDGAAKLSNGMERCCCLAGADRGGLAAYLRAWAENQVMAALKAVRLRQTSGQRILLALGERIPKIAQRAMTLGEHEVSNFAPAFAIASCRHETQYSRLFRS